MASATVTVASPPERTRPPSVVQAAQECDLERLESCLGKGASPDEQWRGRGALSWAISSADDTEMSDARRPSPEQEREQCRQLQCIEALLRARADPGASSYYESEDLRLTPLMLACIRGREDIVALLLGQQAREHGQSFWTELTYPDQEATGKTFTPLMLACAWGQVACVDALLAHGCPTENVLEDDSPELSDDDTLWMALKCAVGDRPFYGALGRAILAGGDVANWRRRCESCALSLLEHRKSSDPAGFSAKHEAHLIRCCLQHQTAGPRQSVCPAWQLADTVNERASPLSQYLGIQMVRILLEGGVNVNVRAPVSQPQQGPTLIYLVRGDPTGSYGGHSTARRRLCCVCSHQAPTGCL